MNSEHWIVLLATLGLLFSWIGGYMENDFTFFLIMYPYMIPLIVIALIYGVYLDKQDAKSESDEQ